MPTTPEELARIRKALRLKMQGKLSAEQSAALMDIANDPDFGQDFLNIQSEVFKEFTGQRERTPGFFERAFQTTGISAIPDLFRAASEEIKTGTPSPLAFPKVLAKGIAESMKQSSTEAAAMLGQPSSEFIGGGFGKQAASAGTFLSGLFGGKEIAQDIAAGNIPGAVGGAIGTGVSALLPVGARGAKTKVRGITPLTITARDAAPIIAEDIFGAKPLSRKAFGNEIRKGIAGAVEDAGKAKGAFVTSHATAAVPMNNTVAAIDQAIAEIQQAGFDLVAQAGEPSTYQILRAQRQQLVPIGQGAATLGFDAVDAKRSLLLAIGRDLDPNISKRINSSLTRAIEADIQAALPDADEYLRLSHEYGELKQIEDIDIVFKAIKEENSPDLVGMALMKAPSNAVDQITRIIKKDPRIRAKVEAAMIEEGVFNHKLPQMPDSTIREIWGKRADDVVKLANLMETAGATSLNRIIGTIFVGVGQGKGFFVRTPGGGTRFFSTREFKKLLDNPDAVALALKGARTPLSSKQAVAISAGIMAAIQGGKAIERLEATQEKPTKRFTMFGRQ